MNIHLFAGEKQKRLEPFPFSLKETSLGHHGYDTLGTSKLGPEIVALD